MKHFFLFFIFRPLVALSGVGFQQPHPEPLPVLRHSSRVWRKRSKIHL